MKLVITGANGFVGRHVVAEAIRRGHRVRAVVRSTESTQGTVLADPAVELIRADLCRREDLVGVCEGADVVLHLAASKATRGSSSYAGTVAATENLLEAMTIANIRKIVGISSFAVYEYLHKTSWSILDENSPLESETRSRDDYSRAKLTQERLIRTHAEKHGWDYAILRPGVIYGRANVWTARLGVSANRRRWVRIGGSAPLPLSYVENCAEAILLAAEKPGPLALTVNVLDDDSPTQSRYANEVLGRMRPRPWSVIIPWTLMRVLARSAWVCNRLLFRGRAKLPAVFAPETLHARFKPLRYSNERLHGDLGWTQRYALAEALDRSLAAIPVAASPSAVPATPPSLARPEIAR